MSQKKSWMISLPDSTVAKKSISNSVNLAKPLSEHARSVKTKSSSVSGQSPERSYPAMSGRAHRELMIRHCAQAGVRNTQVLEALAAVERHKFVDAALASRAYEDCALPIGLGQTISKPSTVGVMLDLVLRRTDQQQGNQLRALEVGTGCGYQAAVMARLFGDVTSIERLRGLAELARQNLRTFRIPNLRLVVGDGYVGLPQEKPFDAIVIAAAGAEVPEALLLQMSIGGLLVAPVGTSEQRLHVIERLGVNNWQRQVLESAHFVPLRQGIV